MWETQQQVPASGCFKIPAVRGVGAGGLIPSFPSNCALLGEVPWRGKSACTAPTVSTVSAPLRSVPGS